MSSLYKTKCQAPTPRATSDSSRCQIRLLLSPQLRKFDSKLELQRQSEAPVRCVMSNITDKQDAGYPENTTCLNADKENE